MQMVNKKYGLNLKVCADTFPLILTTLLLLSVRVKTCIQCIHILTKPPDLQGPTRLVRLVAAGLLVRPLDHLPFAPQRTPAGHYLAQCPHGLGTSLVPGRDSQLRREHALLAITL